MASAATDAVLVPVPISVSDNSPTSVVGAGAASAAGSIAKCAQESTASVSPLRQLVANGTSDEDKAATTAAAAAAAKTSPPPPPGTLDLTDELNSLAVRDVLNADSRPTFVLDLDPDIDIDRPRAILPIFCNTALRQHERLFDGIIGPDAVGVEPNPDDPFPTFSYPDFCRWASGVTPHDDSRDVFPLSILYADLLWTGSTVQKRWRLVSGNRLWRRADTDVDSTLADLNSEQAVKPLPQSPLENRDENKASKSLQPTRNPPTPNAADAAAAAATVAATTTDAKRHLDRRRNRSSARRGSIRSSVASAAVVVAKPIQEPAPVLPMPALPAEDNVSSVTTAVSTRHVPANSLTSYFPPDGSSNDTGTGSSTYAPTILLQPEAPDKAVVDWTLPENKLRGVLSDHIKFARSVNWAKTPLGSMDSWSPEFRQLANLCMTNPFPVALFWGSELTMLYNEAYAIEVAGKKHPALMGTGFSGPFSELWDYTGPIFAECARTGVAVRKENDFMLIDRRQMLEETFYSWSFVPLYGGTKRILGFFNAPFEVTAQVLNQRYLATINNLGTHTAHAKTVKQFWRRVLESLEENAFDAPFALLYSVGDSGGGDEEESVSTSSGSTISLKSCYLEGSIAVPQGHVAAPAQIDLKRSHEGFVPSFREAMRTREPMVLHTRDGTLPEALLEGIQWRGFGVPCREAIIFPLRPTNGDMIMAFLVLGINPRRPYDNAYQAFISMLNRQLSTGLASAILFEDEVRRSRNVAETALLEKEQLTEQLVLQASRLRRMTELSPLGMFLIDPDGVLREANDRFFEMTGNERDQRETEMSWLDFVHENSREIMDEGWNRLVKGTLEKGPNDKLSWSAELQLKKRGPHSSPVNIHGEAIDYWVMFNAHPEFGRDGSLRAIMGSITDISDLKWAQGLQQRQLQEAEETRRQQNEFIDITSHEMRNPLSAILQCADDISSALAPYYETKHAPSHEIVESCVEAAQTISLCVQHQKSIVDDILTISKLDSSLLLITPVPVQPDAVVRRAMKMFGAEFHAKEIKCCVKMHPSYAEMGTDWVLADPSRVLQILINLMTNAIKFTAPVENRTITIELAASEEPPDAALTRSDFVYVEAQQGSGIHGCHSSGSSSGTNSSISHNFGEDWDNSDRIYIRFQVQDTGCGLSLPEKQMLFQRFRQASPRTHAQYGGSGLGLFISKRLAELHGGQIGVASTEGVGSLFGFYIEARRASQPKIPMDRVVEDFEGLHSGGQFANNLSTEEAISLGMLQIDPHRLDYANDHMGSESGPLLRSKSSPAMLNGVATDDLASEEAAAAGTVTRERLDPRDMHILVVEDNLINQKVLAMQLRKVGCTVHTANDGLEALSFLKTTKFHVRGSSEGRRTSGSCGDDDNDDVNDKNTTLSVILMDLEMPNMDGLTCVSEIRKMQSDGRIERHVPVIAVTANVRDEQVAEALRSGMDDVLSKPFRIPELLKKVEDLLLSGQV